MKRSQSFFAISCVFFIFLVTIPALASEKSEKRALEASHAWLILVDNEQYAESWETAAQYFKKAIARDQWNQSLNAVRKPLGKVMKRTVKSKQYATSLPGAPDGEYVVIQYETSFHNKKSSIETITPMLDRDGKWRVSGYYIK
jgi:Protein of unknown function (DUF4019)